MAAPQLLALEDCEEVARWHFDRDNVKVVRWKEMKLGGDKPAGFLGAHKLAEVIASEGGKDECVHVFAKTIPQNESQASMIEATRAFKKEVQFYAEVVKAWEDSGIISKEPVAKRRARFEELTEPAWNCCCYIARDDLVVLENVSHLGYKSDSCRSDYDYEHVVLALKSLAEFHACSLIYEEERSKDEGKPYRIGERFPEMVQDTFYLIKEGHPGEKSTEAGVVGLIECAKRLPICRVDPQKRLLVEERLPGILRRMFEAVKPSPRHRNVLCHADLWQNNILFRRDAAGRPLDVVLVDFQLMRYAPPAHDVYDLLHLSARRGLREMHEEQLLSAYYSALSAALRRRGLSADAVLPRAAFDASLEEQRFAGRLNGAFGLHFLLSSEQVVGPIFSDPQSYARTIFDGHARAQLICTQFDTDPVYRERLEECLMELLEKDVFV